MACHHCSVVTIISLFVSYLININILNVIYMLDSIISIYYNTMYI